MYLGNDDSHTRYDKHGTQRHTQGNFLILTQPDVSVLSDAYDDSKIRACVRQVALEQMGHYMMGTARIGGESVTMSGSYGNNGLPTSVPPQIHDKYCTLLPTELYELWSEGGGHNSAGSEAQQMRDWALDNFDKLTP